jgi:hypothetical protein
MGLTHPGDFLHRRLAAGYRHDDADEAALADLQFDLGALGEGESGHAG